MLTEIHTGVGEASWSFKTQFDVTEEELAKPNADLVLDGLDTFATVFLVRTSVAYSTYLIMS